MNLVQINKSLSEGILKGENCIGFFVHDGEYYWIIDWEAHFNLNQKKNFDIHLQKGDFKNRSQYESAMKAFRGGIPTLTHDLFISYLNSQSAKVVSVEVLQEEFFQDDQWRYKELQRVMQEELSFNKPMAERLVRFRARLCSRLPKFYVNFDRRIFMHMLYSRTYESVVLEGWWGAKCDFEHMIPISHRYWGRSIDEDFWAVTNFSNF